MGRDRACDDCGGSGVIHISGCPIYPGRFYQATPCPHGCIGRKCQECKGGGWVTVERHERNKAETLKALALTIKCQRCAADKDEGCTDYKGNERAHPHVVRLSMARRAPPSEQQ